MKKISVLYLLFIIFCKVGYSQQTSNTVDYIVIMKDGYNLNYNQKALRESNYYSFELENIGLKTFINSNPIYEIKKEYPTARSPYLQRVYRITTNTESIYSSLLNKFEIEHVAKFEEPLPLNLPNDYITIDDGEKNTALDLIRAPMTWGITSGNSTIYVGIADSSFEFSHEDLVGKFLLNINGNTATSPTASNHGTYVAGMLCSNDNSIGSSSVAPNIKIVTAGSWYNNLLLLSQQPGVRVVNASWGLCSNPQPDQEAVIQEIINGTDVTPPVVVVAAAGNRQVTHSCTAFDDYIYPASYPGVISVGSINHWQPRNTVNPNPNIGSRFWEDHYSIDANDLDNVNNRFILNDRIDILAPAHRVYGPGAPGAPNLSVWNGYWRHNGTSFSSPIVAGAAALMLSVNPNLTPAQVRQIIRETGDDIFHITENQHYPLLQNVGRLNVFRAVTTAKCMLENNQAIDLLIRDNDSDYGQEPNNSTNVMWNSPEIWVRNQQDGYRIRKHQNPTYSTSNNTNYVYTRIYNKGCLATSGNETLTLYWAKASTALAWPNHWDGTGSFPDNGPLLGAPIGVITIPSLQAGEDIILELPWQVPNPDIYSAINAEPWHFCLLARITSTDDSMTTLETSNLYSNVNNNNNIAWKNVTVITIPPDVVADSTTTSIEGVVAIGNNHNTSRDFALEISIDNKSSDYNKKLFEESEITLKLDDNIFNQWNSDGKQKYELEELNTSNSLMIKGEMSKITKLTLAPKQIGTINLKFNFLTKELLNKKGNFTLHLLQRDLLTNEIVGGETFEIEKYQRTPFYADAGSDKLVDKGEVVTINATPINKEAVYNWYDEDGNLLYSGADFQIISDISRKFKLEIISLEDGLKDYAEVSLDLKNNQIVALYPNPSNHIINLDLKLNYPDNNYIMITGLDSNNNQNIYNYVVDNNSSTIAIDISNFANGNYIISFVHNGQVTDSETLIKN